MCLSVCLSVCRRKFELATIPALVVCDTALPLQVLSVHSAGRAAQCEMKLQITQDGFRKEFVS